MTLGLIGYGRFGRLAARYLSRHVTVLVYDPGLPRRARSRKGLRFVSLSEAASQDTVIFSVPVSLLEDALKSARPHLRPGTVVIDVCAVKVLPARWMKRILPKNVHILGTHPLFGPDSAARTLQGRTIVVCPIRIPPKHLSTIIRHLRRKGLVPAVMSVDEHDRMAAETIFLTPYLGRIVGQAGLRRWPKVTFNYRNLLRLADVAERDSFTLLADMARFSNRGERVLLALKRAQATLDSRLHTGPRSRRKARA
jgi:prephenate dehydrogenase